MRRVAVLLQVGFNDLICRERRIHTTLVEEGHDGLHRLGQCQCRIRCRGNRTHADATQSFFRVLCIIFPHNTNKHTLTDLHCRRHPVDRVLLQKRTRCLALGFAQSETQFAVQSVR